MTLKLRPFQLQALRILSVPFDQKTHLLCIAPTGSGKSLIYEQVAATPGRKTLLITPLIALARQQFETLKAMNLAVTLDVGQNERFSNTPLTAWILSPEKLQWQVRWQKIQTWHPNFLVVDECHCLWEWGERFRPAFYSIPRLLKNNFIPQSLWLTATLPMAARLHLRTLLPQPLIEMGHFELPPHLHLMIQEIPLIHRIDFLCTWLQKQTGAGILFVATRNSTLRLGRLLEATGKKVFLYHAGLSTEERKNTEKLILKKIPDIIITTSAFGLGMHYPHLNYVILWQAPTSILSLVQKIGRVGRNPDQPSTALVLWSREDFQLLEWTIQNSNQRRQEMSELLLFLESKACRSIELSHYFDPQTQNQTACGHCDQCHLLRKTP